MEASKLGYEQDRFENLNGDEFDCVICSLVVNDPYECGECGNMFCKDCIDSWMKKKN